MEKQVLWIEKEWKLLSNSKGCGNTLTMNVISQKVSITLRQIIVVLMSSLFNEEG